MYIDVVFNPPELASRGDISNKSIVVIDVLRATSTIIYAFWGYKKSNLKEITGCSEVIPVETLEEAEEVYKSFNNKDVLKTGERFCLKPEGFDIGNSPSDYIPEKVQGKTIVFSTTNGTRALKMSESANFVTTASFVNASACADIVFSKKNDVIILCAGRSNKTTREDSACAGLMVELLIDRCKENNMDYELYDSAEIALRFFQYHKNNIYNLLESAEAGQNLIKVNLEKDLKDCSLIDFLSIATEFKNGRIKPINKQ